MYVRMSEIFTLKSMIGYKKMILSGKHALTDKNTAIDP